MNRYDQTGRLQSPETGAGPATPLGGPDEFLGGIISTIGTAVGAVDDVVSGIGDVVGEVGDLFGGGSDKPFTEADRQVIMSGSLSGLSSKAQMRYGSPSQARTVLNALQTRMRNDTRVRSRVRRYVSDQLGLVDTATMRNRAMASFTVWAAFGGIAQSADDAQGLTTDAQRVVARNVTSGAFTHSGSIPVGAGSRFVTAAVSQIREAQSARQREAQDDGGGGEGGSSLLPFGIGAAALLLLRS